MTRVAAIVCRSIAATRTTPLRVSVMPSLPVMVAEVTTLPIAVGRPIYPRIEFPPRLDNDARRYRYTHND